MASACSYAACREQATTVADGWAFCERHHRMHLADQHGKAWPDRRQLERFDWRLIPGECGTEAGARRHHRAGEQPCTACRNGAARMARERASTRRLVSA